MFSEPHPANPAGHKYNWPSADPYLWAVFAIGIVAAFLRLNGLGSDSIWEDEAATWMESRGTFAHLIISTAHNNYPPLYNILVWICIRIFGDAEWSLRLPSALLGTGNVIAIYWVGTLCGGRLVGIFSAVLLCLSGFHIAYSQEARMYALLACTATLFGGTLLRLARTPSIKWTVLSTLAGVGLLYSHLYGALTWAVIAFGFGALLFLEHPGWALSLSRFLRLQTFTFALFLPWALILLHRALLISDKGIWIPEITGYRIVQILTDVSSGAPTLCILLAGLLFAYWPQKRLLGGRDTGDIPEPDSAPEARTRTLWLLSLWAAGPLAAGIAASLLIVPILIPRYLFGSVPAILILASIGFARPVAGRKTLAAAVAVVLIAGFTGTALGGRSSHRPDWRGVGRLMEAQLDRDDCVVIYPAAFRVFAYYYRRELPCLVRVKPRSAEKIESTLFASDRVFIIFHDRDREADKMIEALSRTRDEKKVFRFKRVRVARLARGKLGNSPRLPNA